MSATDTDVEAIGHLDWEVPIECTRKNCETPSAHLARVTPGADTCLHESWFPCCSAHAVELRAGNAYCTDCKETIVLVAIKNL